MFITFDKLRSVNISEAEDLSKLQRCKMMGARGSIVFDPSKIGAHLSYKK